MTDKPHDFQTQLAVGQEGERRLDAHFTTGYDITPATHVEQRQGIDRHFVNRVTGAASTVEYKTDLKAKRTHNAFIETISVDARGKSGWAYTSQANTLMYYIPGDELIYIIAFPTLRLRLPTWATRYPVKRALNEGYATYGLVVPLHELERIAVMVVSI